MIDKVLGFEQPVVRRKRPDNASETYVYVKKVPKRKNPQWQCRQHLQLDRT